MTCTCTRHKCWRTGEQRHHEWAADGTHKPVLGLFMQPCWQCSAQDMSAAMTSICISTCLSGVVCLMHLRAPAIPISNQTLPLHPPWPASCRLMVAFNTSSGIPITFVQFQDASGRARSGRSDGATNQAEAGTISMEFTSIGRLLGEHTSKMNRCYGSNSTTEEYLFAWMC